MSTVTVKLKSYAVRRGCLVYNKWSVLSVPGALQQGSDDIVLCLHVLTFFFLMMSNRTTAESLTNQNEAELQRRFQDRQQEIDQMQQVLETKIQLLQEVCPRHDLHSVKSGA